MRIISSAAAGIAALLVLAGCSVTTVDTHSLTASDLVTKPEYMGIYPKVPKDARVIGPVSVQLCQLKLKDKVPTGDDALRALKIAAAQKGATALADVSFGTSAEETNDCHSTAHASGTAYVHN